jgi:transcriptional regulator of acetoin/glycerol metabolism
MAAAWPGNVRQLEHALTNACVLADSDVLDLADVAGAVEGQGRAGGQRGGEASDRDRIVEALASCGGNKSRAARLLQIPRRTFYRRLAEYDIA